MGLQSLAIPRPPTKHFPLEADNSVREYKVSSADPEVEFELGRQERADEIPETLGQIRNREEGRQTRLERFPELADFYNENDPYKVSDKQRNDYTSYLENLESWERDVLARAVQAAGIEWDESCAHSAEYDTVKTAALFCTIVNRWKILTGM